MFSRGIEKDKQHEMGSCNCEIFHWSPGFHTISVSVPASK